MVLGNIFLTQCIFGIFHLSCVCALALYCYANASNCNYKLTIIAFFVMIGFILAVIKHYILGAYFHLPYPYNTFLFNPNDRFNDFFNMLRACKDNNPYMTSYWLKSVYFPAANIFFYLFGLIRNEWISFVIYTGVFLTVYYCFMKHSIIDNINIDSFKNIFIVMCLTYPILFILDRANLDMYLFLLLFGFVVLFQNRHFVLSCLLLSIAIAMKLYPMVFIFLFVKEKKYKEVAYTIALSIIISILSLWSFKGGFSENMKWMLSAFQGFNQDYSGAAGLQHNISYYGVLKIITMGYYYVIRGIHDIAALSIMANGVLRIPYLFIVALLFAFVVSYVLKFENTLWKNVYLLSAAMVLFPHVSFDYKLIHMLISAILFLKDGSWTAFHKAYLVLFGIMLIPNNYFYIKGDISIAVLVYPVIMTIFAVLMMLETRVSA